ncbi:hypothetical protein [Burkholderia oklahomensis]|uniref:hypothetical protein n=1 Tax=Burkholderia oklahomensis TaxID=342113 RepID=UPI0004734889|nr:hypothetical protein [Burkholderia oklahomensis]AJX32162.1 hypothetical protein BG90_3630 [Burkholderia oklahomensis C6786]AOI46208.1 hypothetical protein WI23_10685 [Burkholderia oklahomensis C6786]KUY64112.1 hypothetical protein WI23_06570 [Burkholderia oklahomensis C6786]MBI0361215.1 hypothetical protein [Burkholderia oklahomensis]SUW54961.1 Uncharacterised protein [Burkholderia oklahomensis]
MNTPLLLGFGALALFGAIGIAASREMLRALEAQKRRVPVPVPVRVRTHRPHRDGRRTVL